MKLITKRRLLLGASVLSGAAIGRYLSIEDIPKGSELPTTVEASKDGLVLSDVSRLNPTPIAKHITLNSDPNAAFIATIRNELAEAKSAGRPFCVSAKRHSMGGHTIPKNGTAITLDQNFLEADTAAGTYRVAAGMHWGQIVAHLDKIGYSPKVMQSNNDFGIASTFCVNAHGWPVPYSACGSTVRSIKLILPDGELITCSRSENQDIFNLSMGGYGLTGAITELEVEMVPNANLTPKYELVAGKDIGTRFVQALEENPNIQMAYGRLDITVDRFFEEGVLITYEKSQDQQEIPALQPPGFIADASREILRGQLGSDRIKSLRWWIETKLAPSLTGADVARNFLINEPVSELVGRDKTRTDILHEYFISPDRFAEFVEACQDVIPSSYQDLLNITLRFVDTDKDSILAYATEPRIAAVMLFSQEMTTRGEADMARMTSALIERVLEIGGTYYLPYRPHASVDQFTRGYKQAPAFAAQKRQLDPELTFRNVFWDRYLADL